MADNLQYFLPSYVLEVGVRPFELEDNSIYKDVLFDSIILEDHHITFKITMTSASAANEAEIVIYNPPQAITSTLKNLQGKKAVTRLKAGFKNGKEDYIFIGVIDKVSEKKEGIVNTIKLNCSDGAINKKQAVTQRTYPVGTPLTNIIRDLSDDLWTAIGYVQDSPLKTSVPVALSGNTDCIINDIVEILGYQSSVQNGRLYVLSPTKVIKAKVSTLISPDTGLIGSVNIESNGSELLNDDKHPKDGISFKCLLNGSIVPEGYVEVKTDEIDAIYKVTKVAHKGSFEDGDWLTEVTCSGIYIEDTGFPL